MREKNRLHALLAVAILIAVPVSKGPEIATASDGPKREESALCASKKRSSAVALLSFAGYGRVALGLPWEDITMLGRRNGNKLPPVIIAGLPAENAPPAARVLAGLAQTVDVNVLNNFFSPTAVRISVGDTVRWTWQGSPHSVTSGQCLTFPYDDCIVDNKFCSPSDVNCGSSPSSGIGFVYSHQFNIAGSYRYFCNEHFGLMAGLVVVEESVSPTIQFSASTYSVSEGGGAATVTVSRGGAAGSAASVDYASSDTAGLNNCDVFNGVASSRCDYPTQVGTVRFAAGETSKNISIPIVDDSYAEGGENFTLTLSNATGATLGSPSTATVTINDSEASNGPNPIDVTAFFVRQQYLDFLNREPDPGGFAGWQQVINSCPQGDTTCDRIHVSSSFFRSPEFQDRGYFVYRFYPVAFGRKPTYAEFVPDLAKVSGFLSDAELEATKVAFINEFMSRQAFVTTFNGLNNTQYVDTLLQTAGITHSARQFWIDALGNGTRTRAQVLREISESGEVYTKYFNQAFVVMQYFGFLRREPDAFYLAWIAVLDSNPNDFRGMVSGFMNGAEYRLRFGP